MCAWRAPDLIKKNLLQVQQIKRWMMHNALNWVLIFVEIESITEYHQIHKFSSCATMENMLTVWSVSMDYNLLNW